MSNPKKRIDWAERKALYEAERVKRFRAMGNLFNNMMLQFNSLNDEAVSFGCSLLSTPSVAAVYDRFLDEPHVFTLDQIITRLHPRTVKRALKRLERFGVIIYEEETKTWSLHLEKGADHR